MNFEGGSPRQKLPYPMGLFDWLKKAHPDEPSMRTEDDFLLLVADGWRRSFDCGLACRHTPETDWGKLREAYWKDYRKMLADQFGKLPKVPAPGGGLEGVESAVSGSGP